MNYHRHNWNYKPSADEQIKKRSGMLLAIWVYAFIGFLLAYRG